MSRTILLTGLLLGSACSQDSSARPAVSDASTDADADRDLDASLDCSPTLESEYSATSQPYSVFVVHLEPSVLVRFPPPGLSNVFTDGLQPLIARADEFNIPLTIFMHQAWVDYIADEGLESLVRSWIDPARQGPVHEIGIHNHGPAHSAASQSGYSNWDAQGAEDVNNFYEGTANDYPYLTDYRGSISDVATAIGDLAGVPLTSGSTMHSWHESPAQVAYEQVGKGTGRNSRFARVSHWSLNGGFRETYLFNAAPMGTTLGSLEATWGRFTDSPMVSEQTWGTTIHAHNFREITQRTIVDQYLCAVASIDPGNSQNKRRTVRDVMENVAIPNGNVFDGFCGDGYCDSAEAGPDPAIANPFPIPSWGAGTSSCVEDCSTLGPNGTGDGDVLEAAGEF